MVNANLEERLQRVPQRTAMSVRAVRRSGLPRWTQKPRLWARRTVSMAWAAVWTPADALKFTVGERLDAHRQPIDAGPPAGNQ